MTRSPTKVRPATANKGPRYRLSPTIGSRYFAERTGNGVRQRFRQRSRLAPRGGGKGKRCDDLESVSVLLPRRSEAATFTRSTPGFITAPRGRTNDVTSRAFA